MNKIRLWFKHHKKNLFGWFCIGLSIIVIIFAVVLTFFDVYG